MKTHSTDLFDLIKSLSAYEKRLYIKSSNSTEKAYIYLFSIISRSQEFNEESYIDELHKKGIKKQNYPRVKNYLYQDILSFLATEELKKKSIHQDLREAIECVRILIERSLISQAEKLLKKSKVTALKFNLFSSYTELLNLEYLIIRSKVNSFEILDSVKNLKTDLLNLSDFYAQYMHIMVTELETYYTIMGIQSIDYKNVYLDDHIDITEVAKAFKKDNYLMNEVLSINAGYLLALTEHFKNDNVKSVDILLKSLAIFENNPFLKKTYSYKYLLILNNLADSALIQKNFEVSNQAIEIMQEEKSYSTYFENTINDIYINIESRRLWIQLENDEKDLELVEKLTDEASKKDHWSIPRSGIEAMFQLIAINFSLAEYSACIRLVNQLIKINKSNLEPDSLSAINILELIIHSEYKNHELVVSKALSLRKIKTTEKKFTLLVTDFFRTYSNNNFQLSKEQIELHLEKLEKVRNENTDVIAQLSRLFSWLEKLLAATSV